VHEIKKRQRKERLGPGHNLYTTYQIDSTLFAKDGGVINLPNPRLNPLRKETWQNIILIENIKPYVSDSLYRCIRKYNFFAFGFIEVFPDRDRCINVIIADSPSVKLLRVETDCGEVLVHNDPDVPYINIWYRQEKYYEITGFNREEILNRDDKNEFECCFDRAQWLMAPKSDLYGFQLVEKELEKRRESA